MTEGHPAPEAASQVRCSGEQGVIQLRRGSGAMAPQITAWDRMGEVRELATLQKNNMRLLTHHTTPAHPTTPAAQAPTIRTKHGQQPEAGSTEQCSEPWQQQQ